MSRRDEFEALLPFYLNGTLSGDRPRGGRAVAGERPGRDGGAWRSRARVFRDDRRQRGDPPAGRCAQPLFQDARARGRRSSRARTLGALAAWAGFMAIPARLRLGDGHGGAGAPAGADRDRPERPRQGGVEIAGTRCPEHALRAGHLQAERPHRRHFRLPRRPGRGRSSPARCRATSSRSACPPKPSPTTTARRPYCCPALCGNCDPGRKPANGG